MAEQSQRTDTASPEDLAQQVIREIVDGVLGLGDVHPTTNLFQCGARSLHIAVVRANILDRYGVDIPLADMYSEPSVERLAGLLLEALASASEESGTLAAPTAHRGMSDDD
ncbi:hypothetical protein Val02_11330 [Virgisporangium aliadipatigenens]|uniref:Carrier domain-containing protein n=1 Tax=Virgisporangium aliadipatigenens TaxID=741659 RepID=A0A8J4DP97_9ACTN|nr:acyl carrier protein [Virgisporangium aliadipatigenens]GIJ44247.1 hypothetical protein Val02_11330 [Virgisporangium aliadipatigenens]